MEEVKGVITMYKWQQVKAMQANGIGAKTIAKRLDLSKNTVKKYIRSDQPPSFEVPGRTKLCDAYRDEIADMLKKEYIGTRIFTELRLTGLRRLALKPAPLHCRSQSR